ncbi:Oligopeptide transporter OPT superfamily [Akanthomyces lecanii RCEF 1005]|uniref:Oligopeptide transporter OPT superfamily n=1 Tax=Akanthomyces lecanii RCEF 1005 TaxID=1081108 RepID=A0A162KZ87_CORDF|nr:Oligopeptide transporter OPT superfamily [Akanthomyces lecanii RCEF 1005]
MACDSNEVQYPASESSNSLAGDMDKEMEPWTDRFTPFPETTFPESSGTLVTLPSILVGVICGIMVNGSNIYLGLKTGWTSSANLLGSVVGFAIFKNCSPATFGPHQNNIVQTIATASAGLSSTFISAIPATYQLGLLDTPSKDLLHILLLTVAGGYFGLLSVVPLRKFFIEKKSAQDLNLVFPSSTVTALTIRAMHSVASSASTAVKQLRVTIWAFAAAGTLRILSPLATGVLWEWHVFTWARAANLFPDVAMAAESWGWFIEWTPAMIGSGMLVDMNIAASFFAGSVLAW